MPIHVKMMKELNNLKSGVLPEKNALTIAQISEMVHSDMLYAPELEEPETSAQTRLADLAALTEELIRAADIRRIISGAEPEDVLRLEVEECFAQKMADIEKKKQVNLKQNALEIEWDSERMIGLRAASDAFKAGCAYMCGLFAEDGKPGSVLTLKYGINAMECALRCQPHPIVPDHSAAMLKKRDLARN